MSFCTSTDLLAFARIIFGSGASGRAVRSRGRNQTTTSCGIRADVLADDLSAAPTLANSTCAVTTLCCDRATGAPKFSFNGDVSDHLQWAMQAGAGIVLAALVFVSAGLTGRAKIPPPLLWLRIAAVAFLPCVLFGLAIERLPVDSFGAVGWARGLAFLATAAAAD